MAGANPSWTCAQLARALCDALVAKGQLKDKPAFIRSDREAKIASVFEGVGLDGSKMAEFDNPGPLEMLVRKGTNGEAWVQQVIDALVRMLPEEAATAPKKMTMDENSKEELAAAKEKSQQRRDRLQAQEEERGGADGGRGDGGRGDGGRGDGGRESGKGGRGKGGSSSGFRDRDREEGWGDSGGGRCPAAPKERGGKGKGKRDRSAMQCLNCKQFGHKSRDCPEPVDEEAVRQRLAAKAAGKPIVPRRDQAASYSDQDD
mmetsp:Transcript_32582/g.75704  ORF Transcript_32582/g.75704 Transcript_32582/m.75704 type:complete len:260 (-) Transcript_32582:93-872(-)|eukprot:CAMPEP_0171059356 /NCGR_PEP_ID=MMETSP0766_2-20121228/3133_1 /TAXON_ID=439317 /ORGANISM="Gambierdiscus australes, Strain CAWD 149" /LENGTH=259 /DNA_ID=CAMNT_0011514785 /DNA_START=86 /DNA_END=865 /DNA_ORIENTATION=+